MIDYLLEHPECGALDPKATIEPGGVIHLPRNLLPTIGDHLGCILSHMSPARCRAYTKRRFRANLPYWKVDGPVESDMLSGCCVFLRREVVEEQGRPMDDRYPLYYEDTDLFRTLRKRGYQLIHHGGARILHHWSRSAGVGGQFMGEPLRRYRISQEAYYRKFYGVLGAKTIQLMNRLEAKWPEAKSHRPMHEMADLGAHAEPLTIPMPREAEFVLELAMAPTFLLAAGIFGNGNQFTFPADAWQWLFQAQYFIRAIDLANGNLLGAWTFAKTTPGRDTPYSVEEMTEGAA